MIDQTDDYLSYTLTRLGKHYPNVHGCSGFSPEKTNTHARVVRLIRGPGRAARCGGNRTLIVSLSAKRNTFGVVWRRRSRQKIRSRYGQKITCWQNEYRKETRTGRQRRRQTRRATRRYGRQDGHESHRPWRSHDIACRDIGVEARARNCGKTSRRRRQWGDPGPRGLAASNHVTKIWSHCDAMALPTAERWSVVVARQENAGNAPPPPPPAAPHRYDTRYFVIVIVRAGAPREADRCLAAAGCTPAVVKPARLFLFWKACWSSSVVAVIIIIIVV